MLSVVEDHLRSQLKDVKSVVLWQEALREASVTNKTAFDVFVAATPTLCLTTMPGKLPWQIFDRCAAITRIYALYEQAVCDLVVEFLSLVSKVIPNYSTLSERMKTQHRLGVGQILTKWAPASPLYGKLKEEDISCGHADGVRGKGYKLLSDAFLVDPENFRTAAINRLFGYLGFDDALASIRKSKPISDFVSSVLSGSDTMDSFLDAFVSERNDIAHGNEGVISSSNKIVQYADFIDLYFSGLAALLRAFILKSDSSFLASTSIGSVLHKYTGRIYGIKSKGSEELKVGDDLYAGKKMVRRVKVVSLRRSNEVFESLSLSDSLEFGVGVDSDLAVGDSLFRTK